MYRKKITLTLLLLLALQAVSGQTRMLTLENCHVLAEANNKDLRQADMQIEAARYTRKSAFTNYLPKVSATGIYMHTGKEISLLSDEQKSTLGGLGDALSMPELNHVGETLVEDFRTDTRNIAGAAVILTQPLYTGGKIRAYNNIARYSEQIARDSYRSSYQNLIVEVDETYWSIVAMTARKQLAEKYLELVDTLDYNIEQMIGEGFATKADGLSVKVKLNEARVAIIQVDNAIDILKMSLCRLCGLPLETPVELADENTGEYAMFENTGEHSDSSWENRPELSALAGSVMIYDEKIKIARAEFLPHLSLTGGYLASYPSVFNSFEKKFKGTWYLGVALDIPIVTWGDRKYKVRSAQAEAMAARYAYEETREKIELQVSQCRRKVREAHSRYAASLSSQHEADENLRYANSGFGEGVIPVSDVITAQTAWLSARTNLISADIDLRLAYVYLSKSLGTIQ